MNILAIDSGITTGVAIINGLGTLLHSQNIKSDRVYPELTELCTWFRFDYVVAEKAPGFGVSKLGYSLDKVQDIIRAIFPEAVWVRSTEWLSTPAKSYAVPKLWNHRKLSPHQKDSYRMALWYLKYRIGKVDAR